MKLMKSYRNLAMVMVVAAAIGGSGTFSMLSNVTADSSMQSGVKMYGHVTATLLDESGNVKQYSQSDNIIVNDGLEALVYRGISPSSALPGGGNSTGTNNAFTHMQLGTGTTAVASTATALGTAISGCIDTFTGVSNTETLGNRVVLTLTSTFSSTDSANCLTTVGEAGIFDGVAGSGSATMFAQNAFSQTITLAGSDSLQVDWTYTFADT